VKRRKFITLLGGAAVAWPLAARAQQRERMRRIGVLSSVGADDQVNKVRLAAFQQRLQQLGWTDGHDVRIDYRFPAGNLQDFRKYAAELVALAPDVILALGRALQEVLEATRTVPIVFVFAADPVGSGFVESLSRPGGNATGFLVFEYDLSAKWLELLKEIAPGTTRALVLRDPTAVAGIGQFAVIQSVAPGGNATGVTSLFGGLAAKQVGLLRDLVPTATLIGFLVNPCNPITERNVRDALDAAQKIGQKIEIVHASSEAEIDAAFDTLRRMRVSALLVQPDAFLNNKRIVALAARDALPAMYQARELVAAGGLMSYGSSLADMYRLMGVYAGKVLTGAKPAEMPVLQPIKFEMAINLQTAKALGLKLSDNLLSLADEVIE